MPHHKEEKTCVIIKPDGVQRNLIGEIIRRYEQTGLKMVAIKMLVPNKETVENHYSVDPEFKKKVGEKAIESYTVKGETPPSNNPEEVGGEVIENLKQYMTSGPVIAMVWEGAHAVELVRKITGSTEPRTSDIGTIRGDFVIDSYSMADKDGRAIRNLIHASGDIDEAKEEIKLWFTEDEMTSYTLPHDKIIYDAELCDILE